MQKRSTMVRFFLSYGLISFTALIAALIIYLQSASLLHERMFDTCDVQTQKLMNVLDARFVEARGLLNQILLDPSMAELVSMESPYVRSQNVYRLSEIQKGFTRYEATNDFIDSIYLYCNRGGFVLSNKRLVLNMDLFYSRPIFTVEGIALEAFRSMCIAVEKYTEWYSVPVCMENKEQSAMLLISPVFSSGFRTNSAAFVVISEQRIQQSVSVLNASGEVLITDANGKRVFSTVGAAGLDEFAERECRIEGVDYVVSCAVSAETGYIYYAAIPSADAMAVLEYVRTFFILLIITAATLLLGLSMALSYMSVKPIKRLLSRLVSPSGQKQNEYAALDALVKSILHENAALAERLAGVDGRRREGALRALLFGAPETIGEMYELRGKYAAVALAPWDAARSDELYTLSQFCVAAFAIREGLCACVLSFDCTPETLLSEIETEATRLRVEPFVALGTPVFGASALSRSYYSALQTLELASPASRHAIMGQVDDSGTGDIWYPESVQASLVDAVLHSNAVALDSAFSTIYNENVVARSLGYTRLQMLVYAMNGTLLSISRQVEDLPEASARLIDQSVDSHMRYVGFLQTYEALKLAFHSLLGASNGLENRKRRALGAEIAAYISEDFSNPDMCLSLLADKYSLSESYISNLIKLETGESFAVFLEDKRLEYARTLLRANALSVADVATAVGYSSPYVFRRAFKRRFAINPSEL